MADQSGRPTSENQQEIAEIQALEQTMSEDHPYSLTQADQQALDALLDAAFELDSVPADLRQRAERIGRLLGLLNVLPAEEPGDLLVERTLQAVAEARARELATVNQATGGEDHRGLSIRLPDLLGVAAMILISLSVALPVISHSQERARQVACQTNLAQAGMGFSRYAADHGGALPAVAAHAGDTWWDTNKFNEDGSTRSNSAHYFLLVRSGYVEADELACNADPVSKRVAITIDMRDWQNREQIPFSYVNLFAQQKPTWVGPKRVILVDRNPLFVTSDKKIAQGVADDALSPRHASLGVQNVLFNDGSVMAIDKPVLEDGDNIWRLKNHDGAYTGTETPADASDEFLVP